MSKHVCNCTGRELKERRNEVELKIPTVWYLLPQFSSQSTSLQVSHAQRFRSDHILWSSLGSSANVRKICVVVLFAEETVRIPRFPSSGEHCTRGAFTLCGTCMRKAYGDAFWFAMWPVDLPVKVDGTLWDYNIKGVCLSKWLSLRNVLHFCYDSVRFFILLKYLIACSIRKWYGILLKCFDCVRISFQTALNCTQSR